MLASSRFFLSSSMPLLVLRALSTGKILFRGIVDISTGLQPLKVALHLIVARHTNPPLLPESFHLLWQKQADGHILVQYVKERPMHPWFHGLYSDDEACCDVCWTRTFFFTAPHQLERQMLCARCEPDTLCDACRVIAPASVLPSFL